MMLITLKHYTTTLIIILTIAGNLGCDGDGGGPEGDKKRLFGALCDYALRCNVSSFAFPDRETCLNYYQNGIAFPDTIVIQSDKLAACESEVKGAVCSVQVPPSCLDTARRHAQRRKLL